VYVEGVGHGDADIFAKWAQSYKTDVGAGSHTATR
jgi:hypothetical protein